PGSRLVMTAAARLTARSPTAAVVDASAIRLRHMRELVGQCDLVLAPSATVSARFAASGMPMDRVAPWTLGSGFRPAARTPRESGGPLRLGFVGAFLPTKAPHLLIDAASQLPPGAVSVDLAGAVTDYHGDRSYRTSLDPWLAHPVVRRHGPVRHDQMPGWLAQLDVLVLPSEWLENSPLVIKEAFAAGLPVIVSDLGGMAEVVRHDVDGLRFRAGDAGALSACVRRIIDEPELLDRLRAGIRVQTTIDADAARTLDRYRILVAASPTLRAGRERPSGQVAAVILNYRAPEQTVLAVMSLQASFTPPSSIVVVDNSANESPGTLRARLPRDHFPSVSVIDTSTNLGFAAGCNRGIEVALRGGAQFVLLMNSDAVLEPDAVRTLLAAAGTHPEAGILAPLVVRRAEPGIIESAGLSFDGRSGRVRLLQSGRPVGEAPQRPFAVDAATGCVMLIRREVFERVGPFDEPYFYSFEDLEFCLRARAAGFMVFCVAGARAHHEGGHAIGRRSARRVYFATRNHLRLSARLQPRRGRRALTAGAILALNTAYVLTSPDAPLWSGLAAVVRGGWHHLLGRYGPDSAA
ncbi:MAG: glycosyltransferase, partial [Vicinamibacterales bacterium]